MGLLNGLLYSKDQPLLHVGGRSKGKLYRYYEPAGRWQPAFGERVERFRARELEQSVLEALDPDCRLRPDVLTPTAAREFVQSLVDRIDVGSKTTVTLKTGNILTAPVLGRTDTIELEKRERGCNGRSWSPFSAETEVQ